MAPTTLFFNGKLTSIPGSYSKVDDSGLASVGLGASGIVGILGTAEGGMPAGVMTDPSQFLRISNPAKTGSIFRSGDLREAIDMLFSPSKDTDIAGAQQVIAMKVNPATAASAVFAGASGSVMTLTSEDFGAFTSQVNVSIANGSTQGKLLAIAFENLIETVDNLGGSPLLSLQYTGDYNTMVAGVEADGSLHAIATLAQAGLATDQTNPIGTASQIAITATAADAGKTIVLLGVVGGVATREVVTLINGTVNSVNTFTKLHGTHLSAAAAGTVTLAAGATTLTTFSAGNLTKGVRLPNYAYVAATTFTLKAGGASTSQVLVGGKNASGAFTHEVVVLNGTTPVSTVGQYTQITSLSLFDVAGGTTVTINVTAARSVATVQKTLQRVTDYFNARQTVIGPTTYGFKMTLSAPSGAQAVTDLDQSTTDINVLQPAAGAFTGDLAAIINWINNNSQLVTAAKFPGAIGVPTNTASPVFLAGGSEGTASFSNWQQALNQLKQTRVNTIVVLSADPAVAAALDAHCAYMCGVGRSERDGVVGAMNSDQTALATKAQALAQAKALNTRNLRLVAQNTTRYDSLGNLREFTPPFTAALVAGMQAGSAVGESLTHKFVNALSFRQSNTWNPMDDAEDMIQGGVLFLEAVDGQGVRWVRNITCYLQDSKLNKVEASVNAAVNYAVFNFRSAMEYAVGRMGFSGTINATKGLAIGTLTQLVDQNVLTDWGGLAVDLQADVLEVAAKIAPVVPINFVATTLHLVASNFAATGA